MDAFNRLKWDSRGPCALLVALLTAVATAACAPVSPRPEEASVAEVLAAPPQFGLVPGDEVEVRFYYTPELNAQQSIRPDGMISLPLIGDVRAAGTNPEQLRRTLTARYEDQLKNPEIQIVVRDLPSNQFFVGGEVNQPGAYPLRGPMTVSQAVLSAAGLTTSAYPKQVLLVRPGPDGKPFTREVNVKDVLEGRDMSEDLPLARNDIVFVPRSRIANAGLFVDQYITNLLPLPLGLTYRID